MQTVEAQVSNAKNLAQAQAEKLAAEGRAAAGIARARGEAAVTQAQMDAENRSRLSQVGVGPLWVKHVVVRILIVGYMPVWCMHCVVCALYGVWVWCVVVVKRM